MRRGAGGRRGGRRAGAPGRRRSAPNGSPGRPDATRRASAPPTTSNSARRASARARRAMSPPPASAPTTRATPRPSGASARPSATQAAATCHGRRPSEPGPPAGSAAGAEGAGLAGSGGRSGPRAPAGRPGRRGRAGPACTRRAAREPLDLARRGAALHGVPRAPLRSAHLTAAAPRAASRAASPRSPPPRRAPRPRQSRRSPGALDDALGQRGTDAVYLVQLLDRGRARLGLIPAPVRNPTPAEGSAGPAPPAGPAGGTTICCPSCTRAARFTPASSAFRAGPPARSIALATRAPAATGTGRAAERRRPRGRRPLKPRHRSRPVAAARPLDLHTAAARVALRAEQAQHRNGRQHRGGPPGADRPRECSGIPRP